MDLRNTGCFASLQSEEQLMRSDDMHFSIHCLNAAESYCLIFTVNNAFAITKRIDIPWANSFYLLVLNNIRKILLQSWIMIVGSAGHGFKKQHDEWWAIFAITVIKCCPCFVFWKSVSIWYFSWYPWNETITNTFKFPSNITLCILVSARHQYIPRLARATTFHTSQTCLKSFRYLVRIVRYWNSFMRLRNGCLGYLKRQCM